VIGHSATSRLQLDEKSVLGLENSPRSWSAVCGLGKTDQYQPVLDKSCGGTEV